MLGSMVRATAAALALVFVLSAAANAQVKFPSADELERMRQGGQFPSRDKLPGGAENPPPAAAPPSTPTPPSTAPAKPQLWGAIGFTADGSFSTAWKYPSKAEAEAYVAVNCAKFGRGKCEIISFSGELCGALATYIGSHSRRRYRLSFTAGGYTASDAQRAALDRCNDDRRTRGRCQLRTVVCGDGR